MLEVDLARTDHEVGRQVAEACTRFGLLSCAILHRTGRLEIDPSDIQPHLAESWSVSPDGKRLLFSLVHRDRDIVEFPLDGSDPRTLLSTDLPEFAPNWSPKGDQFAFVTQRNGADEL